MSLPEDCLSQHKPGLPVAPTDKVPTFHGKILPAGSAPQESSFEPQANEVPSQADNPDVDAETSTSASATLGGSTAADVHTGYGHPGQGQTSKELRHDGRHGRVKQPYGLAGLRSDVPATNQPANPRTDERQRALDDDQAVTDRGYKADTGAEDVPPETA